MPWIAPSSGGYTPGGPAERTTPPTSRGGASDDRPELDKLRERLDGAMGALRILGSQVRALRAEVEALRGEPK